jgi:hypothetical protein
MQKALRGRGKNAGMPEEIRETWKDVIEEIAGVIAELVETVRLYGMKRAEETDLGMTVVEGICPEAAEEPGEDWEELVRVHMHEVLPEVFMEAARRAGLRPESCSIWPSGDTYVYEVTASLGPEIRPESYSILPRVYEAIAAVGGRRAVLTFDVRMGAEDEESCEATLQRVAVTLLSG